MADFYRKAWERKIPQMLFYLGLTIELLIVIIDKSNYINPVEGLLFRITFVIFAGKIILTRYHWKEVCLIAFLEVIAFISYRVTGENDILRIVTFTAACKDIPLKQMLRYAFQVTLAGCAVIILLAVSGVYGEISLTAEYGRGFEQTRYTLGMGHPNALSCMFIMVTALGIYVYAERMKWYFYLFLMLLNIGVYGLTDSKTGMMIATALLTGGLCLSYCRYLREKWPVYVLGLLIFAVCLGFSIDAAACAPGVRQAQWNETYLGDPGEDSHAVLLLKIDRHINGRIVSLTDSENNDGAITTWLPFSSVNNMNYYFDMGWVKLFYRYGIIPGILYCIACLALLWQLYRRKDAFGLLLFVVFAVYSVVEAHLFSVYVGRNYLLMIMGSYFLASSSKQAGKE